MFFQKKEVTIRRMVVAVLFFGVVCGVSAGQDIRFSDSWKFYRGTPSGTPSAKTYSDASWQTVYLPHTDSVILNYSSFTYYIGYSWYRKSFSATAYQGKKIFLEFEAAMQSDTVYVNGTPVSSHIGGYTPHVMDITSYLRYDTMNVVAVKLNNSTNADVPPGNSNPDFLYFGGLYRNAHLLVMDSLHITNALYANVVAGGGIFVTDTLVTTSAATVRVKTHVLNEHATSQTCLLSTTIVDSNGTTVATGILSQAIAAGASNTFSQSFAVTSPHLWHPNAPYLYKVKSQVYSSSTLVDTLTTTIGIRTIAFSHANGFQINGLRFYYRGADRHQAYPYIGNAVPNSGQYRDALRMKEYGFNFVRMSHYVQAESFVDACDKLGILGMACLPGWQYYSSSTAFSNNCMAAIREMVRYYRNHPSVVLWETSLNETSYTDAWASSANSTAHAEFPGNQMYTCGWLTSNFDVYSAASQGGVRTSTDTRPINICEYGDWDIGCVWGTPITGCQDRVVRSDGEAALLRQATNHAAELSKNRALSWLTGDQLWSAYDYQSWNNAPLTSSGALDIFRIPKYSAFFFKSQRAPGDTLGVRATKGGPMVFIASQWTSSSARPVTVFSNCEQVSLYLNGALVSTQSPVTGTNLEHPYFSFSISSFTSGTLIANGLIGGVVRASDTVITPGTAAKVVVTIDTADIPFVADGSDIAIVYGLIVDANGQVVPTATNSVTFSVSGSGTLIGVNPVVAQAGIASILLRAGTAGGQIIVNGTASGPTGGSDTVTAHVPPTTGTSDPFRPVYYSTKKSFKIQQAGGMLIVRVPGSSDGKSSAATFSLFNAQGKRINNWNLTKNTFSINIKAVPHGLYMGELLCGRERYIQKVVVQ